MISGLKQRRRVVRSRGMPLLRIVFEASSLVEPFCEISSLLAMSMHCNNRKSRWDSKIESSLDILVYPVSLHGSLVWKIFDAKCRLELAIVL